MRKWRLAFLLAAEGKASTRLWNGSHLFTLLPQWIQIKTVVR